MYYHLLWRILRYILYLMCALMKLLISLLGELLILLIIVDHLRGGFTSRVWICISCIVLGAFSLWSLCITARNCFFRSFRNRKCPECLLTCIGGFILGLMLIGYVIKWTKILCCKLLCKAYYDDLYNPVFYKIYT